MATSPISWNDKYVSATGTEPWATNSAANPSSLSVALANAVAGDRVWIKGGSYTLTSPTMAADGTGDAPIVWIGYDSTTSAPADWPSEIMPRDFGGTGPLNTTNFPIITVQTTALIVTGDMNIMMGLSFVGSIAADDIVEIQSTALGSGLYRCRVEQQSTTTTNQTRCVSLGATSSFLIDCDAKTSAAGWYSTSSNGVVYQSSSASLPVVYCRFEINNTTTASRGKGPSLRWISVGNLFYGGARGSFLMALSGGMVHIGNTIYGGGELNVRGFYSNFNFGGSSFFLDNHVTDCDVGWSNGAGSPNSFWAVFNTRTRDNTTEVSGNADLGLEKVAGN
ncbi:MAG TPA: hypothetical protein ENK43_04340, partial [Planctomycetes bacterium]|nr:hypothetical protein [Planctomycetota bacterium]